MSIKDKEGNVYKLRGPNPLVKDRADWDKTAVKIVNSFGSKTEVIIDARNPVREAQEDTPNISKELNLYEGEQRSVPVPPSQFIEELSVSDPIPDPPISTETSPQESITINVHEKIEKIFKERGSEFYCAPVIGQKTWSDELYGDSYTTNKYGTNFVFDAVVVAQSDLEIQFWCVRDLTKESVILSKNPQGGERCWRVTEKEPKSGGFLCKGMISDVNPDFS